MFFLSLLIQALSEPFEETYEGDGYATLPASRSPATLTIKNGHALMMVEWPDAIIKISHSGLGTPKTLTHLDGYSLFTFNNAAIVEMTFKSTTSFYVVQCPQENSNQGAIQYFSNVRKNSYSSDGIAKDIYFSLFGIYDFSGSIKTSGLGSATIHYYDSSNKAQEARIGDAVSLKSIHFSSSLIRSMIGSLIYQLKLDATQSLNPTVVTYLDLQWEKVSENNNNYAGNNAYGGFKDKLITKAIKDIVPKEIKYEVSISSSLTTDYTLGYQFDDQKIQTLSLSAGTISFPKNAPFTFTLYVKSQYCNDFVKIKSADVNNFAEKTTMSISLNDVPDQCKYAKKTYYLKIKNGMSVSTGCQIVVIDENNRQTPLDSGEMYSNSAESYKPFSVTVYLFHSGYCQKLLGVVNAYESETNSIIYDNSIVPEVCLAYTVCIVPNLPDSYKLGYIDLSDDKNTDITPIGTSFIKRSNEEFEVQLYLIKSEKCASNFELNKVKAVRSISSCIQYSLSNVPDECKEQGVDTYSVCFDLTNIPNTYSIGYTTSLNPDADPILLDETPIEYSSEFSVTLYLLSGSNCEIGTYNAQINSNCVALTENDITSKCTPSQQTFYIKIENDIDASGYTLYVKKGEEYEEITKDSPYTDNQPNLFMVEIYIKSQKCTDYTLINSYQASLSESFVTSINDANIPEKCLDTTDYIVCIDLSEITDEYSFGYKVDYEESQEMHALKNGKNTITYNGQFTLSLYITKGPNCNDNQFYDVYTGRLEEDCSTISLSTIQNACKPNEDTSIEPGPVPKGKYYCICKGDDLCNDCTNGIESNDVTKVESMTTDPGEGVIIKVFANVSISSSVFTNDHNVEVNKLNVLTITNVENVDVSDTTKLKVGNHLNFDSGDNVIIEPKSSSLSVKLSTVDAGKPFTIQIPESFNEPLKLVVTNNNEKVKAPKIKVEGEGELNAYDYPFNNIEAVDTVKVIKGVILICSPQEDGEKCDAEEINDYKVLNVFSSFDQSLEKDTKIIFYLYTFSSSYLDIDINKLSGQELMIFAENTLLENGDKKLRVMSTTVLHSNNENVKLEGSSGSTIIDDDYANSFVVGYNDQLKVVQDEKITSSKPQITVQAQKKDSTIVFENKLDVQKSNFYLDTAQKDSKVTIYLGDNEQTDIYNFFGKSDDIDVNFEKGAPSKNSNPKGGLGTGGIIGIVVAVVVVVAAVIGVVVFLVIRKRKNDNKSSVGENEAGNDDI
ncbi:hypothetical protein M9Y10_041746 [Tritrichomonas musculus]|uniref:Uncharacterized protein n=1 Tax=Tritrichomonas musculus TaxID=1915356 RepID=A0ABR2K5F6_9EUKA